MPNDGQLRDRGYARVVLAAFVVALMVAQVQARAAQRALKLTPGSVYTAWTQLDVVVDTIAPQCDVPATSFSIFPLAMIACEVTPRLQNQLRLSLLGGRHGP